MIVEIKRQTTMMAKALNVSGLMNVQFAIQGGDVYVLEVTGRLAHRAVRVQATGLQLAKIAARRRPHAGPTRASRAKSCCISVWRKVFLFVVSGRGHHSARK